jgi:hypothetical protein
MSTIGESGMTAERRFSWIATRAATYPPNEKPASQPIVGSRKGRKEIDSRGERHLVIWAADAVGVAVHRSPVAGKVEGEQVITPLDYGRPRGHEHLLNRGIGASGKDEGRALPRAIIWAPKIPGEETAFEGNFHLPQGAGEEGRGLFHAGATLPPQFVEAGVNRVAGVLGAPVVIHGP